MLQKEQIFYFIEIKPVDISTASVAKIAKKVYTGSKLQDYPEGDKTGICQSTEERLPRKVEERKRTDHRLSDSMEPKS